MPFDTKKDQKGKLIDFDEVYARIIAPAAAQAPRQPKTTARNPSLGRQARQGRGEYGAGLADIESALLRRRDRMTKRCGS